MAVQASLETLYQHFPDYHSLPLRERYYALYSTTRHVDRYNHADETKAFLRGFPDLHRAVEMALEPPITPCAAIIRHTMPF